MIPDSIIVALIVLLVLGVSCWLQERARKKANRQVRTLTNLQNNPTNSGPRAA